MKKKILVTVEAGYICSHTVVDLFFSGYPPIIVNNMCNTSERNIIGINNLLKTTIKDALISTSKWQNSKML